MITLYRAVSQKEKDDYDIQKCFKTGKNTLEGKQFFRSPSAVKDFVNNAILQEF